jgi:cyclophilin family peptidyl-prolyl cis-trans isomerase
MTDKRQRQKEQRAAKKEAEKKAAGRKELRKRLLTAFGFGAVVVGFFAVGSIFSNDGELPKGYEAFRAQPTACDAEQPPSETVMEFEQPEVQTDLETETAATATIATSCGPIVIDLELENTATANSFVFPSREGFYNGQVFHRIFADYVIESGDPSAGSGGGPGYRIPDEYPAADFVFEEGMVAMANLGKSTTGSQFFITIGDNTSRTPTFNILGTVVSGQDVLDKIAAVPVAQQPGSVEKSLPLETVYIEDIQIDVTGS